MIIDNKFKIVVQPSDVSCDYAAAELRKYLRKIADLGLRIFNESADKDACEIIVGKMCLDFFDIDLSGLGEDGIIIKQRGNKLLLCGEGSRGTLYSVYEFLESLGVRFYSLDCEYVPTIKALEVKDGFEYVYAPIIKMRDTLWSHNFDIELSAKQRINCSYFRKFTDYTGGGKTFAGYFGHTFGELSEAGYSENEPCLTDENVYQTMLKNVLIRLRANPEAKFVSVSQNDDFRYCTCEKCCKVDNEEESHSGTMIRFVNRIADAIKDEFPHVLVHTFAYQYTRKPPKYVKPRDNVFVQLCSIECCFNHSLAISDCQAPAPWMEGTAGSFKEDLIGWSKIAKNIFIWDYTTNFHHYFSPFPNLLVLRENIEFFIKNNVSGILEQGNINSPHSGEFGELKAYILAKLLWNPAVTKDQYSDMIDDFLAGYYGSGWQYIRRYIDGLAEITKNNHVGIYYHPLKILPAKDGLEFMLKADKLFDTAVLSAQSETQRSRIERSRVQILYYLQIATYESDYICGNDERRKKYVDNNKKLYDFVTKNSIYMNPDITLPSEVDFTKSPDFWHKLG